MNAKIRCIAFPNSSCILSSFTLITIEINKYFSKTKCNLVIISKRKVEEFSNFTTSNSMRRYIGLFFRRYLYVSFHRSIEIKKVYTLHVTRVETRGKVI